MLLKKSIAHIKKLEWLMAVVCVCACVHVCVCVCVCMCVCLLKKTLASSFLIAMLVYPEDK